MAIPVKLNVFEGPLDLLLHLIDKNKIDIYDIPIVEITDQYMEYIHAMEKEDLGVMSEFMVMAATLLDIKCRMLLPKEVNEEGEEESTKRDYLQEAFDLVYAVNTRSLTDGDASTNILKFNTYKDRMETLILLERARELCFEGKRWFDLMRYNYRHVSGVQYDKTFAQQGGNYVSNYSEMLSLAMSAKYTSPAVMATKMPTEPYLYWPINTAQMDVNSKLVQNPVWQASASSARK